MQVSVKNIVGETVGEIELNDNVFGIEPNKSVMHQALVRQLANARQGTHKAKTRGEIRGTTAKWFRQKGTGRARHGSRKAPIFVGGGVAHGPQPRKYTKRMPRKMRRLALRSALSAKVAEAQVVVIDDIQFDKPQTKQMIDALQKLAIDGSAVLLLPDRNENVERSVRNLPDVKHLQANLLNIKDLLGYDYVIIPQASVELIESFLG